MKNTTLAFVTLFAVLAANSQAAVTATPFLMTAGANDIASGTFLDLITSNNHRVAFTPSRTNGRHEYASYVYLANPALSFGVYSRMEIRFEGSTTNTTPLVRFAMDRFLGSQEYIGAMGLPTAEGNRVRVVTGNVNRFIFPGGVVRLWINGFFGQPFTHRFDKISVVFS